MIDLSFINLLLILLLFALACAAVLFIFQQELYSRLSVRITVLIFASGLAALIIGLAYNEITSDTLSSPSERLLQIAFIVIGGPVVVGLLAAHFVRRPLQQFNKAVASLEQDDYKVQLKPTGIREFDEIFSKFNDLIKRLQHEEKLRRDLVSDTSHELNTPLTIMVGQLTAIQEGKYPMTEERVTILKEQAERLTELVQQLDTYTKARMPASSEREDIKLRQFCEDLIKHFGFELKQKAIDVRLHIAKDYIIRTDRGALQQIIANLMQNTLRYSEATEIDIKASGHKIIFSDNGKGVPAESLSHLFERFYRVDKSRSRATGGLGLGLAIVKELVENQGWEITAEENDPGLTFVLKTNP